MDYDVLDAHTDWFSPCLPGQQSIPRNFKLAIEVRRSIQPHVHLEFVFYNFIQDEFIVVEPMDSLHLMAITIESADGTRYITTAIEMGDWISLKSQLVYIGLV